MGGLGPMQGQANHFASTTDSSSLLPHLLLTSFENLFQSLTLL